MDLFKTAGIDLAKTAVFVTRDEIMAARTPKGGWTRHTLEGWGIQWPPTKGWIDRLTNKSRQKLDCPQDV